MTTRTKRYVLTSVVLAILTFPFAVAALPDIVPDRMERARRWSESLSAAQIRGYVNRLDSLSVERQRYVFALLSPAERSSFWRSRFVAYLGANPNMVEARRSAVLAASALLSPEFFENPARFRAQHRLVLTNLKNQFAADELIPLVGRPPASSGGGDALTRAISVLRETVAVHAKDPDCECSFEQVFQCPNCNAEVACNVVPEGCWVGWFSWGDCYGLCRTL